MPVKVLSQNLPRLRTQLEQQVANYISDAAKNVSASHQRASFYRTNTIYCVQVNPRVSPIAAQVIHKIGRFETVIGHAMLSRCAGCAAFLTGRCP